jgi:hypothetical protein
MTISIQILKFAPKSILIFWSKFFVQYQHLYERAAGLIKFFSKILSEFLITNSNDFIGPYKLVHERAAGLIKFFSKILSEFFITNSNDFVGRNDLKRDSRQLTAA